MLADMRERGLTNLGFSGASRWSASESFLGGYLFDRNYGNFSTGVDTITRFVGSECVFIVGGPPAAGPKTGLAELQTRSTRRICLRHRPQPDGTQALPCS